MLSDFFDTSARFGMLVPKFPGYSGNQNVKAMRFHRPCYGIWDEERTRLRVMGVGGASRQTCEWLLTSYKVGGKT
jgi:hypothetical protein